MATEVHGYWATVTLFVPVPNSEGDKGAVRYIEGLVQQIDGYCLDAHFGLAGNAKVTQLTSVWRASKPREEPGNVYILKANDGEEPR